MSPLGNDSVASFSRSGAGIPAGRVLFFIVLVLRGKKIDTSSEHTFYLKRKNKKASYLSNATSAVVTDPRMPLEQLVAVRSVIIRNYDAAEEGAFEDAGSEAGAGNFA